MSCLGLLCHNDFILVGIRLSAAVFLRSWWQRARTQLILSKKEQQQEGGCPNRENISVKNALFALSVQTSEALPVVKR